jgi:hypothetical protein
MNKAFERLSQRKNFRFVLGWVKTTEVTRGADGDAHPHFHVLLMVPSNYFVKNYLDQAEWADMWRRALRLDYTPVVDVRAVKGKANNEGSVMAAVRETLKYAVKPADMLADRTWLFELTRQLANLRFIAAGGVLKDVLRPDEESERDLVLLRSGDAGTSDERPAVVFTWRHSQKRYGRPGLARKIR